MNRQPGEEADKWGLLGLLGLAGLAGLRRRELRDAGWRKEIQEDRNPDIRRIAYYPEHEDQLKLSGRDGKCSFKWFVWWS